MTRTVCNARFKRSGCCRRPPAAAVVDLASDVSARRRSGIFSVHAAGNGGKLRWYLGWRGTSARFNSKRGL